MPTLIRRSALALAVAVAVVGQSPPAASAALEIAPERHVFPDTLVGESSERTYVVTNTGPLPEFDVRVVISDEIPFHVDETTCSGTLEVGASCTVDLRFSPWAYGLEDGNFSVVTATTPLSFAIGYFYGTGRETRAVIAPAEGSFGDVATGRSKELDFVVTNLGPQSLDVSVIGWRGKGFRFTRTTCFGASVGVGRTCTVSARFAPTVTGPAAGGMTVFSNSWPLAVDLTGTGVDPVPTQLAVTGPAAVPAGGSATLSARLTTAAGGGIADAPLTLGLGSGDAARTCSATTNAGGTASCVVEARDLPLGPTPVSASFAGDAVRTSSEGAGESVLFSRPAGGSFAVGDADARDGASVTFWSARWSRLNALSGGQAPSAFKGLAATVEATSWSSPSELSFVPAQVPAYMPLIATSRVVKEGDGVSGDIVGTAVVRVDAYAADGTGTGTVVALLP